MMVFWDKQHNCNWNCFCFEDSEFHGKFKFKCHRFSSCRPFYTYSCSSFIISHRMKNLNSFEGERVKLDRKKAIVCHTAVEQFFSHSPTWFSSIMSLSKHRMSMKITTTQRRLWKITKKTNKKRLTRFNLHGNNGVEVIHLTTQC